MQDSSVRPADDIETIVHTYGNTLYRLCLVMLGNESDAEDAVQETFIKFIQSPSRFEDNEHKKAWLLTVASNRCRDMLRFRNRHPQEDIEKIEDMPQDTDESGILDALMNLPEKYRLVLTLYYVDEYSINDIAKIIGRTSSAVKMRLQKGRKLLEVLYRKEYL